jgi:hypothetical protein
MPLRVEKADGEKMFMLDRNMFEIDDNEEK